MEPNSLTSLLLSNNEARVQWVVCSPPRARPAALLFTRPRICAPLHPQSETAAGNINIWGMAGVAGNLTWGAGCS